MVNKIIFIFFQKDGKEEVDEVFKVKRDKFFDFDVVRKVFKVKDLIVSNFGSISKVEKDGKDFKEKKDKDGMVFGVEVDGMDDEDDENKEIVVEDCFFLFCMVKYEYFYLTKIEYLI